QLLRERQIEPPLRQLHAVNLEWDDAVVNEPLKAVRLPADRAPAAGGLAGVEAAVGGERQAVDAALEAGTEREAGALVAAVDLLQHDAQDVRLGLVADEALAGARAELAARRVQDRLARGLAHAAIRKPDGRRRHGRHPAGLGLAGLRLAVEEHAARQRFGVAAGERRLLYPAQRRLMAEEIARADVAHLVRLDPLTLVVAIEEVAIRAEIDAIGRAQAGGVRNQFAFRGNLDAPAAPRDSRLVVAREADVERNVEVPLFVAGRAEGELVI